MRGALVLTVVLAAAVLGCTDAPGQTNPNAMHAPLDAGQVAVEIEAAKAGTPLPPGATWRPIDLDFSGTYGELSGLSFVEFQAACAWFESALAARESGNDDALIEAQAVIGTIPRWRTFSDPVTTVPDFRAFISRVSAAAHSDDMRDVEAFTAANCAD